jgi:hypothetical protein
MPQVQAIGVRIEEGSVQQTGASGRILSIYL